MAAPTDTTGDWFGTEGEVSRLPGLLFKWLCLGATLLALLLMLAFLLYVFNDAFAPFSASIGWLGTFVVTVVLPALALAAYYYRSDTRAGEVAYIALGLPIAAVLLAGGVAIVLKHVITPHGWFALSVSIVSAAGAIELHARNRPGKAIERLVVVTLVPLLAVIGVPALGVDYTVRTPFMGRELVTIAFSTPKLVPSLREVILSLPVLPTEALALLTTFTAPVALVVFRYVDRVRENERDGAIAGGATIAVAALGLLAGPLVGLLPWAWIVLVTVVGAPAGLYVESVLRRGEGVSGLAFPIVVCLGAAIGVVVTNAFGFVGPDAWLTWDFLTSAHSRRPADAGIYPALVGSVMMMIVVAASAFPLGVGAAIYLEEYAPNRGMLGKFVELLEINIANLAGVPSVVYGVLGLTLFVRTAGLGSGIVIVGGFTISLLILPIVIVSAQEAIRAVPDSQRQASYGMGATRWQTVSNVVLPRALPGILTGTILAFGRAIGETAPLLMIGAAAIVSIPPGSFFDKFSAMPRQIFAWSRLIDHDFRFGVLAAGVVTLLVVLLMMNGTAIVLRNKYQRER